MNLTKEQIAERLARICVEHLNADMNAVTVSALFVEDLGADSLDLVELVMAAEEEFNIEIADATAAKWLTFQDAVDGIARLLSGESVDLEPLVPARAGNRDAVYAALDGERDYQDSRWNPSTTDSGGRHSVAEFVLFMEHYLGQARMLLSTSAEPQASLYGLDFVRKVAALGVACMEQNGVVERVRS